MNFDSSNALDSLRGTISNFGRSRFTSKDIAPHKT